MNLIPEQDLKLVEEPKPGRPPKAKAESSQVNKKGAKKQLRGLDRQ
jgi:hypothetical protein